VKTVDVAFIVTNCLQSSDENIDIYNIIAAKVKRIFEICKYFFFLFKKRRQKAEGRKQKAESRRQKAESRRQKAESRKQKAESRRYVQGIRHYRERSNPEYRK
jgi:hypothetical protein